MKHAVLRPFVVTAGISLSLVFTGLGHAASHREAPLIALDPAADITDAYAFRSWNDPSMAGFIMNVIRAQDPSAGPNYFSIDDDVLYQIHLDTNEDGISNDIVHQPPGSSHFLPHAAASHPCFSWSPTV